jgi:hypothetical protein
MRKGVRIKPNQHKSKPRNPAAAARRDPSTTEITLTATS